MLPDNKETLDKLVLYLEDIDFSISIVEINEPAYQRKIIDFLKQKFNEKINVIDLKNSELAPLEEIKRQIDKETNSEIIFILNLHQLVNQNFTNQEIIRDLNFSRDLYTKFDKTIVFFIPTYFVEMIINQAQDFYDFVSLTFKFHPKSKPEDEISPLEDESRLRHFRNRAKFLEVLVEEIDENSIDLISHFRELAIIYYNLKNSKKTLKYLTTAIQIAKKLERKDLFAKLINDIVYIFIDSDVKGEILFYLDSALLIFKDLNDKEGISETLINYGWYYLEEGEYNKSIKYLEESIEIFNESNNTQKIRAFNYLSNDYIRLNDLEKAEEYIQKAYDLQKESNNFDSFISILSTYSSILLEKKNYHEAIKILEDGRKFTKLAKNKFLESSLLHSLGNIYFEKENYDKAIEYLNESIKLTDNLKRVINLGLFLSEVYFKKRDYLSSLKCLLDFNTLAKKHDYKNGVIQILRNLGKKHCSLGYFKEGLNYLEEGLKLTQELKERYNEALLLYDIGIEYYNFEIFGKAVEYLNKSLKIFDSLNDKKAKLKVLEKLAKTYYDHGKYHKSIKVLKFALILAEETKDMIFYEFIIDSIVKCYFYIKEIDEAIRYQKKLIFFKTKNQDKALNNEKILLNKLYSLKKKNNFDCNSIYSEIFA